MSPKVSIVMSVFNGASYLRRAIDSILGQSFTDFEFIIIDDGSTDDTQSILQEYADERIRLFSNDANLGLTRSLNKGIEAARGEFLARLDVDDVAQRNRLERQAACLEGDRKLGIVGSICSMVDEDGRNVGLSDEPSSDIELRWRSLTGVPFQHPSVMIRKDVLDRHRLKYDEQYETAQDYDLWVRLLGHAKGMNIQDPLVTRTRHQKSIGHRLKDRQSINHARVALGAMEEIWPGHPFTVERFNDLRLVLAVVPPGGGITNKDRCLLLADYGTCQRF
jgi:glycosyltransferase involved in cell wall biosynthesis